MMESEITDTKKILNILKENGIDVITRSVNSDEIDGEEGIRMQTSLRL